MRLGRALKVLDRVLETHPGATLESDACAMYRQTKSTLLFWIFDMKNGPTYRMEYYNEMRRATDWKVVKGKA